ncbi:laccase [Flammula alnicola]|nr:laccase [Flammula alnicola]
MESTFGLLTSCLLCFFVTLSYAAVGPQATLQVVNKVISPDGFSRSASLVNGVYPAPVIAANKGATFGLNVVNSLSDSTMLRSTSIHWHGIFQRGTNWADGPVGVSQCPIAPNHSFLYKFSAPTQAGTFWYHSHFGAQYCDGMRGALVIYDPNDPQKALYHYPSPSVGFFPDADATLINGKGRYPGGPITDLLIVNVEHGKRYRLRLVSIACDPTYTFSIDNHLLTVIEADSESVNPVVVDTLEIFPGQRYSVVLNANQPINNYWIRSLPDSGKGNLTLTYDGGLSSAILRYKGAPNRDPATNLTQNNFLDEMHLHALVNPAAPGAPAVDGADVNINLALTFDDASQLYAVNGATFEPPSVPVLLQILSGARSPHDFLPKGSVITLPRNKSVSLSVPGGVFDGPHPFHLHGHSFSVVRSAGTADTYNYVNPVRRDVVSLGDAGSNVTIRFRTDNPGPWIFHCHIDWHLNRGLAVVFAEDPQDTPQVVNPPQAWKDLCPIYDGLAPSLTSVSLVPVPT